MQITDVEIDDRNETHVTRHGISLAEIVQVFATTQTCGATAPTGPARMSPAEGRTAAGEYSSVRRQGRRPGSTNRSMGSGQMSAYDTEDDRRALEADFEQLPTENSAAGEVSTVVSVRLRGDELAAVEQAARAVDMPLSTFIRQAALGAASPLDVRAASARAEAIEAEAHKLIALLRGEVA